MNTHCYDLPIRVLISQENGEFVAHALELDLVGCGKTEKAAKAELSEMVRCQLSYASQTNRPELVVHPAPREYFERWEKAHEAALRGFASTDVPVKLQTKATFVSFTPEELKAVERLDFKRTTTLELAKAS